MQIDIGSSYHSSKESLTLPISMIKTRSQANSDTKADIVTFTSLSLFMSQLPHDGFNFVSAHNLMTGSGQ